VEGDIGEPGVLLLSATTARRIGSTAHQGAVRFDIWPGN